MPADVGTRKGASIEDVSENSKWKNAFPWMEKDVKDFPVKTYT